MQLHTNSNRIKAGSHGPATSYAWPHTQLENCVLAVPCSRLPAVVAGQAWALAIARAAAPWPRNGNLGAKSALSWPVKCHNVATGSKKK